MALQIPPQKDYQTLCEVYNEFTANEPLLIGNIKNVIKTTGKNMTVIRQLTIRTSGHTSMLLTSWISEAVTKGIPVCNGR